MKDASYRIVYYPKPAKYIGIAWNYDKAVLVTTQGFDTYTEAREALGVACTERNVRLRWFDGDYTFDHNSDMMVPGTPEPSAVAS